MPTGLKMSVRISLAIAILLTITISWILSTGIANYVNYLTFRSLHQQMASRPDIYPFIFPEPRFGIAEFLTGRPPFPRRDRPPFPPPPPGEQPRPPIEDRPAPMDRESREKYEIQITLLRFVIALGIAGLAAIIIGKRFTSPLMQLFKGADAYQSGDFTYRIPTTGRDEFTAVADAMNAMASQVHDHISRLEKDADHRRKFLADIAHELRSPVTTMRTMAGALQDGVADEPERRNRAVAALVRTSDRMLRLVQELMELAKLDLNELPLDIKQVDLSELISAVLHSHEVEASSLGVVIHSFKAPNSIKAMADPDRLTQVLDNIVENAVNYAGEGAEITVTLEAKDTNIITIKDTGKGIRADDLPYVFDSFYRADSARTPGDSHSGLGLSIARKLTEAHGGSLFVTSQEGVGTTVTIELPRFETSVKKV